VKQAGLKLHALTITEQSFNDEIYTAGDQPDAVLLFCLCPSGGGHRKGQQGEYFLYRSETGVEDKA
jgi:hypothetical protein